MKRVANTTWPGKAVHVDQFTIVPLVDALIGLTCDCRGQKDGNKPGRGWSENEPGFILLGALLTLNCLVAITEQEVFVLGFSPDKLTRIGAELEEKGPHRGIT